MDKGLTAIVANQSNQISALTKQVGELQKVNEQTVRYHKRSQKLNELAQEYVFDPADELEAVGDFSDEQFERHVTKTVTKYSKRDSLDVPFFDDPTIPLDKYARGGTKPTQVNKQQIDKYKREAEDRWALKGGKGDFQEEFQAVLKEHGVAV